MSKRFSFSTFCDDVRQELGNKTSLMGIYGPQLTISGLQPAVIPKLCVVVWVVAELDDLPSFLKVRVLTPPNRREVILINANIDESTLRSSLLEGSTKVNFHMNFPIFNFHIIEQGFVEVMVDSGLGEERAGRLMIKFSDDYAVTSSPSEEVSTKQAK